MSTSLYVASAEPRSGKSAVAVGLLAQLCALGGRVGVFRPVVQDRAHDPLLHLLHPLSTSASAIEDAVGVTYDELHHQHEAAVGDIVDRFHRYAADHERVLVVGSDYTGVAAPTEFSTNAGIAAHLGAPMLLIIPAADRTAEDTATAAAVAVQEALSRHAAVAGVLANRVDGDVAEVRAAVAEQLEETGSDATLLTMPADPLLSAPTVGDLMAATDGVLRAGDEALLEREVTGLIVAAMTMPNVLDRLREGTVLICPGDREDVLLGAILAHRSSTFPSLGAIVLNGGLRPSEQVSRLVEGLAVELPIIGCEGGTMRTAMTMHDVVGRITPRSLRKIEHARSLAQEHVDVAQLVPVGDQPGRRSTVVTPLMFEHEIMARAREVGAHVVLPEGGEDRILRAADTVLARGVARLTLLGDEPRVRERAAALGLRLDAAEVVDPLTSPWREDFARTYAELRAHKGVTLEQAQDIVTDPAYFGTLMVKTGRADGMVSGSITTTAHTIRPALEVIRTSPGVSVVSSVFFMCLADKVLVYGDCAINPDPDAEQLADIAISSAATAEQFGVEPRVAMLSYSTGGSGSGADVDKVRAATDLVRERQPSLLVEGPIQYDAAVDPSVAATKLQDSPVAGQATVLVFPDLNTGNNTYKAVQRSAAAVAVGPVLQGLNAPVNDLSRGATVRDIINTVAITGIQAGAGR
ncbi:phosphate acetyltransferase [Serinicoccus sediminis]|uniref:phosphate acetyltransferase n=1 Tax=Serinicoccus sediminis TaxID=2306021 RepID=UPI00101E9C40|nr:phosphate acetyltransferase [Serinicoccus sediminis]